MKIGDYFRFVKNPPIKYGQFDLLEAPYAIVTDVCDNHIISYDRYYTSDRKGDQGGTGQLNTNDKVWNLTLTDQYLAIDMLKDIYE